MKRVLPERFHPGWSYHIIIIEPPQRLENRMEEMEELHRRKLSTLETGWRVNVDFVG